MIPLCFAQIDEVNVIKKITGNPEVKKHLEDMGFVTGGLVANIIVFALLIGLVVILLSMSRIQRWL